jgi:hypothetical protein
VHHLVKWMLVVVSLSANRTQPAFQFGGRQ